MIEMTAMFTDGYGYHSFRPDFLPILIECTLVMSHTHTRK